MPPVIVGIAAGVAAAGVVSTAAAIAIGIGAAALTYAATPKFDGGSFANEAFSQQQMLRSPVEPRRGIYGRAMVSGPLVFAEETGTDNAYLHLVIPLAGHRCDGIEKIYFGDDVAWANGALTAKYASVARIKIHLGNQTTSDPDLTAECRQWTSAHVGFGVTYLYARLKFDTKVFPNGVPNIKALVRGKQVYDPRKTTHNWSDPATWEWSDNWALCCLDYNRFESGVGAAAHEIDLSYFAAAANDSDQLVEYKTGKFEKRYTCNGTYNTDVSPSSIMEKMLTAGAGMHVYVSGQYRLYAGVYQGPEVLVLTEDDAAGDIDVRPYTPRAELCNAVRGTFVDPENFYQPTDFPPYESSYYRAQDDGEYIDHDLDLPFTQSVWTAQRLGKLYLEQKRAGMQISMPVKMIGVAVSVGKVVGLSLPRLGIDGTFQIVDWQFDYGKPVSLILVETSPELFDYAMGSYTERDLTPNVILPNPATVPTPVGLQYVEYQDDPQWQGELTWSAPANNSSYRYVIEVSNGLGEVVYQTNADATRLLLPKFDAGFYTVSVWALNLFANRSNAPATITIGATLPAPVTGIEVIAGPLTLTLRPTTAAAIAQTTQFEILGSITNNIADAALIGTGKDAVWPDRHPNTRYQVWARTINNYGASSWYGPVQATTSADNSSIIDLIGNTFKSYTWFAWADDNQGTGFTTVEALGDGKAYMGLATDKPTATPSGNWQDYTWSKIKPDIGPIFTPEEEAKLDNLLAGKLPNAPDKDMLAAQDALNNPALANNLITALSLLNQGINAPALGGETPSGAQSKASSAQSAAIAAAATDATTKANNAKAAAESYALAKANLAETTAKAYADGIVSDEEARAIADAQAKADAAKAAAIAAAAADATSKANNARAQAEANAALDALNKANTAKDDAISTASTDATNKIGALKIGGTNLVENSLINADSTSYGFANRVINLVSGREYVFSAAGYVSQKALDEGHYLVIYIYKPDWSFSKALSISTLSESVKDVTFVAPSTGSYSINSYLYPNGGTRTGTVHCSWYKLEEGNKPTAWAPAPVDLENYALNQAAQAQSNATASAALDALNKANAAKADAISTASTDATTKANNAKTQAISSAATDATTKADAAKAAAIAAAAADATTKANNAKAQAEANAALDAINKANTAKADAISANDILGLTTNGSYSSVLGATCGHNSPSPSWDGSVYSKLSHNGGASITVTVESLSGSTRRVMVGLTTVPSAIIGYNDISFAIYADLANYAIYESGSAKGVVLSRSPAVGDVLNVKYDGLKVYYSINGTVLKETVASRNLTLFFKAAFYGSGFYLNNITFTPLSNLVVASDDATTKANNAQSAAIAAAAADATTKANNAKAQAEANAALDAINKANAAKTDAISTAATDATAKANSALTAANAELNNRINAAEAAALDNLFNISGLPYRKDIVIGGDSNKYYPVVFWGGSQDVNRRIKIWRGYNEQAPNDWYSSTHKGQLTIDWLGNFGGWGGAGYFDQLLSHRWEYTELLGDLFRFGQNQAYCFMLRGGGAIYHFASDLSVLPEVYYNQELLHAGSNTYAPAPSTTVNSERILYAKLGNASFGNLLAYSGQFTALKSRLGNFGGLTAETIAALAIATNHLQAGAVTVDKVSANAITAEKIAALAIATNHLQSGAITADKVGANAITAEKIAALAIATNHLQAGAVTVDKVGANAITAEKIAALAIATNHLQSGVVTADKITADTALIQKLIANVGLFNQLQAQLGIFGGLAANSIAAGAIQADKLAILAREYVNPVSTSGNLIGWGGVLEDGTGGNNAIISYDSTEKAIVITSNSMHSVWCKSWKINHDKIYRISMKIKANSTEGLFYLGAQAWNMGNDGGALAAHNGQGNMLLYGYYPNRLLQSTGNNIYFSYGAPSTEYVEYIVYLIGANRDVNDCPAHTGPSSNPFIKLDAAAKEAGIRLLNWSNTSTKKLFVKDISVTEVGAGQVVAQNIAANAVTADKIAANAVSAGKIAANAVTANELLADAALINKLVATSALFDSLVARLAVFGGLTANSIASDAILGRHIKAGEKISSPIIEGGEVRLIGSAFMKVQSATAFGPDGLVEWYGPKLLLNGAPDWANLRKSNAITYLAANGDAYFGGSLSAGVLKTGVTNSSKTPYTANSYPVEIGPFGTNGKPKVIVVSFNLSGMSSQSSAPSGNPTQPQLSWQLQRKIGSGSWATVSSGVFSGVTDSFYEAEPPAHWETIERCSGSSTYTDNTVSTSDFSYRILVVSFSRFHATANVNTQTLTLISTEQ
ncbi:phage tail tip protein J-related protein [Shewanella decolorationis]|uniref:phage tail tip protein J-related protein n=1 Tax=Shewanella decolorationis TaxID=256839 RepID=UPI001A9E8283|nr:hypothetical protein [Shewanella decolorationis]